MWTVQTLIPSTEPFVSVSNLRGLPFFSTNKTVVSLSNVNYQSAYQEQSKPIFEPVSNEETLPDPIKSILYVFEGLYEVDSLSLVNKYSLLNPDSYFKDYIEEKTYILTNSPETTAIKGSLSINESEFASTVSGKDINLLYVFDSNQDYSLVTVESEGLVFTPGTGPHTFFFDNSLVELHATNTCSPRPDSSIVLNFEIALSKASNQLNALLFDLTAFDLDFIDNLTWESRSYVPSFETTAGTLIYNNQNKIAICLN